MGQWGRGAHLRTRLNEAARLHWDQPGSPKGRKGFGFSQPQLQAGPPLPTQTRQRMGLREHFSFWNTRACLRQWCPQSPSLCFEGSRIGVTGRYF